MRFMIKQAFFWGTAAVLLTAAPPVRCAEDAPAPAAPMEAAQETPAPEAATSFWVLYRSAISKDKKSYRIPLGKARPGAAIDVVMDIPDSSKGLVGRPDKESVVIYSLSGYDELRAPQKKPRFTIRCGERQIIIERTGEPKSLAPSPELADITHFIVDGVTYPASFDGKPFSEAEAACASSLSSKKLNLVIRYEFTPADRIAGVNNPEKFDFHLTNRFDRVLCKQTHAGADSVSFTCDSKQFRYIEEAKPIIQELDKELDELRAKITYEAGDSKEISRLLDSPAELKAYAARLKGKKNPDSNQYLKDLIDEYCAKLAASQDKVADRLGENNQIGSLAQALKKDVEDIRLQIIRKSDGKIMKTVGVRVDAANERPGK